MIDYRIRPNINFNGKVGELVWMLEHSRSVTINEISQLSQYDLDYTPTNHSNSIGALLSHIAAIEFVHQVISFENRDLNEDENKKWGNALQLGESARAEINNHSITFYLDELNRVRENTILCLKSKKDSWLYEENKWNNGVSYNNFYLWYHVMEDEISHRGQIRTIIRMLKHT